MRKLSSEPNFKIYQEHGAIFPLQPLKVEKGATVAVVLLDFGEPQSLEEIGCYVRAVEAPLSEKKEATVVTHFWTQWKHKRHIQNMIQHQHTNFEIVGTGKPFSRAKRNLQKTLADRLERHPDAGKNVSYKVYISNTFGANNHLETIHLLQKSGIRDVVLLPLFPHFSPQTTGRLLKSWQEALEQCQCQFSSTLIHEFALAPAYIEALSHRIDEGLQRFDRSYRQDIPLIFATPHQGSDASCRIGTTLIQASINAIEKLRHENRVHRSVNYRACGSMLNANVCSFNKMFKESLNQGQSRLLIVPMGFITDHYQTYVTLDGCYRKEAEQAGIRQYELTTALNCQSEFVEALAKLVQDSVFINARPSFSWIMQSVNNAEIPIRVWPEDKPANIIQHIAS